MKPSWRTIVLWALPVLVIGFFVWQGAFSTNPSDLVGNSATAIVQATDSELGDRGQQLRVDLPGNSPELITKLREADVDFDSHPANNNGAVWGILGNLIFPILLISALFFLFRRSNNMPGGPGQAMNFGKSKAKFMMEAETGVMFDDVAGIEEANHIAVSIPTGFQAGYNNPFALQEMTEPKVVCFNL